jgi:N-methylhydantoinase A
MNAKNHTDGFEIGVDIGGTFTDIVCYRRGEPLHLMKISSTRSDPGVGVLNALAAIRERWGIEPQHISRFVHGTTVATNAVLERKGAPVGLITTAGFKDVLEIGRQSRRALYSVILEPETPALLVPSARRKEAVERVVATGEVLIPLDEASLMRAASELVDGGVRSIAVSFLFSFLHPHHELRARDLILEAHREIEVSLSCEVDPAFREYERTLVTVFDSYIKPTVRGYIARLEKGLGDAGVSAPLQIMHSRGGTAVAALARERPVRLFLSGPAAGVIGGLMTGRWVGSDNLITIDIGGTSSDIALVTNGKALIRPEGIIDGFTVRVPMIDVNSIGSGGGSIAWLDDARGLRVGPRSAGSEPGPACYGRGGIDATVTDASLVLGYVNPNNFAGGSVRLDKQKAITAIEEKIARPLGLSIEEAALGIHRVINAQMAEGIRLVSVRQGLDPRNFTLIPLGGAGPLHATALARELGMTQIAIPRYPGVLSAVGLLAAEIEHDVSAAFPRPLADTKLEEVRMVLKELDRQCASQMAVETASTEKFTIQYFVDMCYVGQAHYLEIPLRMYEPHPLTRLYQDFLAAHDRVHGHSTNSPARIVNLRTVHRSDGGRDVDDSDLPGEAGASLMGERRVLFAGSGTTVPTAIYDRAALKPESIIKGPAILEQSDTTVLIEPGWQARSAARSTLLISLIGS